MQRSPSTVVTIGFLAAIAVAAPANAADRDLYSGLAYLRAGALVEAERDLLRYRDEEPNPEIRTKVDRVLPLLRRPLTTEVREYVATTLEEAASARGKASAPSRQRGYWARMFPVFP